LCAQAWAVWLGQVSAEPLRHAVDGDDSDPVLVRDVGSDTGKVDGVPNLASSMFFCYYRKDLFEERLSIRARIFGTFVGRNPPFRERARRRSCVRERSPTWLTLRRILFPLVPRRAEPKQGNIAGGVGTWGAGRAPKQPRRRRDTRWADPFSRGTVGVRRVGIQRSRGAVGVGEG